jgi:hypothetical protein
MMGRSFVIWACKRFVFLVVCLDAAFVASGCSSDKLPPTAAVSGSVLVDDAPLTEGAIRFVPIEGTPGQKISVQIENGRFSASEEYGPTIGRHRIEIESSDTGGLEFDDEDAIDRLRSERIRRIKVAKVPPWYNHSSMLREEVTAAGPNEFSFELFSKRRR